MRKFLATALRLSVPGVLLVWCSSLAAAQMTNVNVAGDVAIAMTSPDQGKVLTPEEAKKFGSQPLGSVSGSYIVQAGGIYQEIDTKPSLILIRVLNGPPSAEQQRDIAEIKRHPGDYVPPVLLSLATAKFNNGAVEDAIFWLHAGWLRASLDTKSCTNPSVGDTTRVLLMQMPLALRKAALSNPVLNAKTAHDVSAWDAKTPMRYDHRWIAFHGIQANMSALGAGDAPTTLTVPRSQWNAIAEKNRSDYVTQMTTLAPPKPLDQ